MLAFVAFLIHLLILVIVFGLLWWAATAVIGLLPQPIANVARVLLIVLFALTAVGILLGEFGFYETTWSYRHHPLL